MLKRTPLFELHAASGARLVDFAGWEMPVHYGSQLEEHHQVRRDAGMFDVSHMLAIDISGADARALLRMTLTNNADKLTEPGKALYTCMLNKRGGVIDDLIVYWLGADKFRVVVNAGCADKDYAWLSAQRDQLAPRAQIAARRDLAMLAVQGPNARAKFWRALPGSESATRELPSFSSAQFQDYFIARTGYTGEDGFEVLCPAQKAPALWNALCALEVGPCGLGARDTLRLEAGMRLYGQDMDEDTTPMEAGLGWCVDLAAGRDFIGRASLEARPATDHSLGLILLDKGVLRAHQSVHTEHGVGITTSGSFAPTLNRSIALARMPKAVGAGASVQVSVREKMLRARVVKPPFVRNGAVLLKELE